MTLTQEQMQQRQLEDLSWLMSSPRGRRFIFKLLSDSGVFRMSYVQGDPTHTAFREGQRALGNFYLATLSTHLREEYIQMLKEGDAT